MELKQHEGNHEQVSGHLLIVPYGIETGKDGKHTVQDVLLIVPYGIETWNKEAAAQSQESFNRTLWN